MASPAPASHRSVMFYPMGYGFLPVVPFLYLGGACGCDTVTFGYGGCGAGTFPCGRVRTSMAAGTCSKPVLGVSPDCLLLCKPAERGARSSGQPAHARTSLALSPVVVCRSMQWYAQCQCMRQQRGRRLWGCHSCLWSWRKRRLWGRGRCCPLSCGSGRGSAVCSAQQKLRSPVCDAALDRESRT